MKLCLLANAASIHTQRWARHFATRGFEVAIASLTPAEIPGVQVWQLGRSHGRLAYVAGVPRLRRLLTKWQPDILHAHYAGGYGLMGALAGHRPWLLTAWGSDVLVAAKESWPLKLTIGLSLRRADLVTSVAGHMTEIMVTDLHVPRHRIRTFPMGADTAVFRLRTAPRPEPLIVSTRNLEPIYSVQTLVEALPQILAAHPNARAVITGEGSQRGSLEARVRQMGLEGIVRFGGRLTPAELADILARAQVYVSTALSDGTSVSLNEAMACGSFPVVSDIPANREWLDHGKTGFLVKPGDPSAFAAYVTEALTHASLRDTAALLNWKTTQERGSWANAMARTEESYLELLRSPIRNATILECESSTLPATTQR